MHKGSWNMSTWNSVNKVIPYCKLTSIVTSGDTSRHLETVIHVYVHPNFLNSLYSTLPYTKFNGNPESRTTVTVRRHNKIDIQLRIQPISIGVFFLKCRISIFRHSNWNRLWRSRSKDWDSILKSQSLYSNLDLFEVPNLNLFEIGCGQGDFFLHSPFQLEFRDWIGICTVCCSVLQFDWSTVIQGSNLNL